MQKGYGILESHMMEVCPFIADGLISMGCREDLA